MDGGTICISGLLAPEWDKSGLSLKEFESLRQDSVRTLDRRKVSATIKDLER